MFPMELRKSDNASIPLKEKHYIDETDNNLFVVYADEDGHFICEVEGDSKVYVYNSEIPKLICVLQEIYNEHKHE